jgi:hypothetical protein
VLDITRTHFGASLNYRKLPQVRGMAHGRSPITTPHGEVEHFRMGAQDGDYCVAVRAPNRLFERVGQGAYSDSPLERSSAGETILPRNDQLRIAELGGGGKDSILREILEFRMASENTIEGVALALAA